MSTAIMPEAKTEVFVNGENIENLIAALDVSLIELQTVERQGDYVKIAAAMDIFLDFRNRLKDLLE